MSGKSIGRVTAVGVWVGLLALTTVASADQVYVTVDGTRQGVLKGESTRVAGKIEATKFGFAVTVPVSAAGLATAQRQYGPVRITKLVGAASPQLFQALVTNELLNKVTIDFVATSSKDGSQKLAHNVVLSRARVVNIEQSTEPDGAGGIRAVEEISFVFVSIEFNDIVGGTTAVDDRSAGS
jgi:type VI secretion system Hcp family effector